MKKIISAIMVLTLCICLISCAVQTDVLSYQVYPISMSGTLEFGDESYDLTLNMTSESNATLQFTSPKALSGYIFTITPEGTTLSYGDLSVPYNNDNIPGGTALLMKMLSLNDSEMYDSKNTEQNGIPMTVATYDTELGKITVYVSRDTGMPLRFEVTDKNGITKALDVKKITVGKPENNSGATTN